MSFSNFHPTLFNNAPRLNKSLPGKTLSSNIIEKWNRNPSWPALADPLSNAETFVGLFAVFDNLGTNFFAINCTTSAGNYQIDFGDGTITSFTSGSQAERNYVYNTGPLIGTECPTTLTVAGSFVTRIAHGYVNGNTVKFYSILSTTGINEAQQYYVINATATTFQISNSLGGAPVAFGGVNGTANLLPYQIAVVTITCVTGGSTLGNIILACRHSSVAALAGTYTTGWLEIKVAHSFAGATLQVSSTATTLPVPNLLENAIIINTGATTLASCFGNSNVLFSCRNLNSVSLVNATLVTNMVSMFQNCTSLFSLLVFNTTSIVDVSNMFNTCLQLTSVPLFNTASVTNMSNMLSNCNSLTSVPLFNTASVTNMSSMFVSCYPLTSVPLFNTASVTNMTSMFQNCYSLTSVPLFNTASVTNMPSMLSNCNSLTSVPLFNTASVTNMSNMLSNCNSLTSVPLFNTASVTNMSSMLSNCNSLTSVPLFNTASVTNMSNMFVSCRSLISVPLFNTASVTNMSSMLSNCNSLNTIPAFNFSSVSSSANTVNWVTNSKICRIKATGIRFTHSIITNNMSGAALNEYYTGLPVVVGQTLTRTNNWGVGTDTPAIATGKGWTLV